MHVLMTAVIHIVQGVVISRLCIPAVIPSTRVRTNGTTRRYGIGSVLVSIIVMSHYMFFFLYKLYLFNEDYTRLKKH